MSESTIVKLARVELQVDALMDYGSALRAALVTALMHVPQPLPADVHAAVLAAKAKLDVIGDLIDRSSPTGGAEK